MSVGIILFSLGVWWWEERENLELMGCFGKWIWGCWVLFGDFSCRFCGVVGSYFGCSVAIVGEKDSYMERNGLGKITRS